LCAPIKVYEFVFPCISWHDFTIPIGLSQHFDFTEEYFVSRLDNVYGCLEYSESWRLSVPILSMRGPDEIGKIVLLSSLFIQVSSGRFLLMYFHEINNIPEKKRKTLIGLIARLSIDNR